MLCLERVRQGSLRTELSQRLFYSGLRSVCDDILFEDLLIVWKSKGLVELRTTYIWFELSLQDLHLLGLLTNNHHSCVVSADLTAELACLLCLAFRDRSRTGGLVYNRL